jgi:hypothetical protein
MMKLKSRNAATVTAHGAFAARLCDKHLLDLAPSSRHCI